VTRSNRLGIATCLVWTTGCLRADFDVDRDIAEQRVPGSLVSGLLDDLLAAPIAMNVDVASETEARGTGPATAARLSLLELSITDTAETGSDDDDFAFLDEVSVFVESTREGSSLPRLLVAEARGESGLRTLRFTTIDGVDLLAHVEEGARFASEAVGRVPPDDVTFDGAYRVRIEIR
jgi:hypothetical protein